MSKNNNKAEEFKKDESKTENSSASFGDRKSSNRRNSNRRNGNRDGNKTARAVNNSITAAANCNDIDWYVHDATEARQIGSIPFSFAAGIINDVGGISFNPAAICVADVTPMYGTSDSPHSAMNIGIRRNYANTRKANSGSSNYTATFEGMYMLTFDSIYYLMQHIHRAFSVFHTYSTWNRYFPRAVLTSLGFSYDDIAGNFPQYIARYNNVMRAISVWNVPNNWPIFKRHAFLFGAAIIDSKDPKDQTYFYRPSGYYKFHETNTAAQAVGSKLEWIRIDYGRADSPKTKTVAQWLDIVEELLSPVVASATAQILNGDISKAFGDEVYKVNLITGEEPLVLIDDDMAREQFMNATPVGKVEHLDVTERVSTDVNEDLYIVVQPTVSNRNTNTNTDTFLLTTYHTDVTPEFVIEASRFMVPLTYHSGSEAAPINIEGPVSDVVEYVHLITLDDPITNKISESVYTYIDTTSLVANNTVDTDLPNIIANDQLVSRWSYFDYAPRYISSLVIRNPMGEPQKWHEDIKVKLSNYTIISRETLQRINQIAIQKLFGF